jgi:hypothetical protein
MRVQSIGDYYTLRGAADELGVSYWDVWRVVLYHQAPVFQLGQTLLVMVDDVYAALRRNPAQQPRRDEPSPALGERWLAHAAASRGQRGRYDDDPVPA